MSSPEVVTFGEAMGLFLAADGLPLRQARGFVREHAGAESNLAVALARLGHRCAWMGRVGDDAIGHYILGSLRGEGVDVSGAIVDDEASTGLLVRDQHAQRRVEVQYHRGGSAGSRLSVRDIDEDVVARARLLHATGITPALSESCHEATVAALEAARRHGVTTSWDPNLRLRLWSTKRSRATLAPMAELVDIVLTGVAEAEVVSGRTGMEAAAGWFVDRGARLVAVKRGEAGAWVTDGRDSVDVAALPVLAVDPVGAGDAFDAGFLSAWLEGGTPYECARRGNALGAMCVQSSGDTAGLPYRRDLDAVLNAESEVDR